MASSGILESARLISPLHKSGLTTMSFRNMPARCSTVQHSRITVYF